MHAKADTALPTKWATFLLGDELLGLPVEDVQEVVLVQPLTAIPLAPDLFLGLLNLRGQVMPVLDLARTMGIGERDVSSGKLLVVKVGGEPMSLHVDEVGDVLDLPETGWRAPPETVALRHRRVIDAIYPLQGKVVLALKLNAMLTEDQRAGLK
jgi:purine-binding chemotaxis protein CheW